MMRKILSFLGLALALASPVSAQNPTIINETNGLKVYSTSKGPGKVVVGIATNGALVGWTLSYTNAGDHIIWIPPVAASSGGGADIFAASNNVFLGENTFAVGTRQVFSNLVVFRGRVTNTANVVINGSLTLNSSTTMNSNLILGAGSTFTNNGAALMSNLIVQGTAYFTNNVTFGPNTFTTNNGSATMSNLLVGGPVISFGSTSTFTNFGSEVLSNLTVNGVADFHKGMFSTNNAAAGFTNVFATMWTTNIHFGRLLTKATGVLYYDNVNEIIGADYFKVAIGNTGNGTLYFGGVASGGCNITGGSAGDMTIRTATGQPIILAPRGVNATTVTVTNTLALSPTLFQTNLSVFAYGILTNFTILP